MNIALNNQYTIAFWVTLTVALALIIGGFFCPPIGEISGSVLTAVGEIFLWPTLAFGAKALSEGKTLSLNHNNTSIEIRKPEEEID